MNIPATLFDRHLTEKVDIKRQDIEDKNKLKNVASNIDIIILPAEQPDLLLPTAQVVSAPTHKGFILNPEDDILAGDIVVRSNSKPKLHISGLGIQSGVQVLEFGQTIL